MASVSNQHPLVLRLETLLAAQKLGPLSRIAGRGCVLIIKPPKEDGGNDSDGPAQELITSATVTGAMIDLDDDKCLVLALSALASLGFNEIIFRGDECFIREMSAFDSHDIKDEVPCDFTLFPKNP